MTKRVKIAAAAVGAVVLVIAVLPLFVNVNTFRPMIEQQLTTALGRQVKVGDLSLSVLSGSVVARDLSIADDPQFSTSPFLTASSLRIGVEMIPLIFHRQLLVRDLEVNGPQIHLIHAANGVWNFSTIGGAAASRTPSQLQASMVPNLTVDSLLIKDGRATVQSLPAQGAPLVYDQLAVAIQNFSFSKQFPVTLSANMPGQGTVSVLGKAGPIDPHNAAKTTFDAKITLRHLDPVAAGFLDKSAGITLLADLDADASSNGQVVTSKGTVHTQGLRLRPDAVPAPKPIDITYNVTHNLQNDTGQIIDAAAQTGKIVGHLSGTYSLLPVVQLNTKLVAQGLPIDELQSLLPAAGVKLPNGSVLQGGTLTTTLAIKGPLQDLVISGPVEADNTRLAGFNVSSQLKGIISAATGDTGNVTNIQTLRVNLDAQKSGIRADNIYVSLPSIGVAVGNGTVSPSGALNFRLSMKVDTSRGVGGKAVGLLSMVSGAGGSTVEQAAKNGIPVTITGTSSNPIITPDVGGLLKNNASSLLGNGKNGAQGVVNSLGGLFGKKQ